MDVFITRNREVIIVWVFFVMGIGSVLLRIRIFIFRLIMWKIPFRLNFLRFVRTVCITASSILRMLRT